MKIKVIKTISGKYKIVDAEDDDAPLISFHNECNEKEFVEDIFNYLTGEKK